MAAETDRAALGQVRLWDRRKPAMPVATLYGHQQAVNACVWLGPAGAGALVASGSNDRSVRVYSVCVETVESGKCPKTVTSDTRPRSTIGGQR